MKAEEYKVLREGIDKICDELPHKIASFDVSNIAWTEMRAGNIGKYSHFGKKVYLNSEFRNYPEGVVSTLAHELHHMWQHQEYGVLYFLMCIPFLRNILLERTAIEVENAADELMGNGGIRDADKGSGLF